MCAQNIFLISSLFMRLSYLGQYQNVVSDFACLFNLSYSLIKFFPLVFASVWMSPFLLINSFTFLFLIFMNSAGFFHHLPSLFCFLVTASFSVPLLCLPLLRRSQCQNVSSAGFPITSSASPQAPPVFSSLGVIMAQTSFSNCHVNTFTRLKKMGKIQTPVK